MPQISLFFFLFLVSTRFSLLSASLPALPDPLPLTATTLPPPSSTVPAFPEQSDVSSSPTSASSPSSTCPLSLPSDLVDSLSAACPPDLPPSRCCPSLAASLYAVFAPSALSLPVPSRPSSLPDLPAIPNDSESCASGVESALRSRGVDLPRLNATCDVAYCYCGVRLRRLTCAGGGGFMEEDGRWAPTEVAGRMLQRECRRPGVAGCSHCLDALNQLSANVRVPSNPKQTNNDRECQLMGLTWLLSKNRTLYLPTATSVLRAFMAVPDSEQVGPAICSIPLDEMPFAVGSNEINGESSAAESASTLLITMFLFIISAMIL